MLGVSCEQLCQVWLERKAWSSEIVLVVLVGWLLASLILLLLPSWGICIHGACSISLLGYLSPSDMCHPLQKKSMLCKLICLVFPFYHLSFHLILRFRFILCSVSAANISAEWGELLWYSPILSPRIYFGLNQIIVGLSYWPGYWFEISGACIQAGNIHLVQVLVKS